MNGGAIHAVGERTSLTRVEIAGNTAGNVAGGIAYGDGAMRVERSVIDGNTGHLGGGIGIGGSDSARVVIKDTTISGNTSFADFQNAGGGGITVSYFGEGVLKASNITISATRPTPPAAESSRTTGRST